MKKVFLKLFMLTIILMGMAFNLGVIEKTTGKKDLTLNFKSLEAKADGEDCMSFGFAGTTTWAGRCYSCFCDVWPYTGKDKCL